MNKGEYHTQTNRDFTQDYKAVQLELLKKFKEECDRRGLLNESSQDEKVAKSELDRANALIDSLKAKYDKLKSEPITKIVYDTKTVEERDALK